MNIFGVLDFLLAFEVGIHKGHTAEERLLGHLVGGQDLDHPVDHLGPERRSDGMSGQEATDLKLASADVFENVLRVILGNLVRILSLESQAMEIDLGLG